MENIKIIYKWKTRVIIVLLQKMLQPFNFASKGPTGDFNSKKDLDHK